MKKLLSAVLALTLSCNPFIGYCETSDEKIETSLSSETKENSAPSDSKSTSGDVSFRAKLKNTANKMVSYLTSTNEKIKTLIDQKATEQKSKSISKKQQEFQTLQTMSTSQYLVRTLEKLGFSIFKYSLILFAVVVPGGIYTLFKSNEGYKNGQINGYNDGKKAGEAAGDMARIVGEAAGEKARLAGEKAGEKARLAGEAEGQKIIDNAKMTSATAFVKSCPTLKRTRSYLDLLIKTLDGASDSFTTNILVAGARSCLDALDTSIRDTLS